MVTRSRTGTTLLDGQVTLSSVSLHGPRWRAGQVEVRLILEGIPSARSGPDSRVAEAKPRILDGHAREKLFEPTRIRGVRWNVTPHVEDVDPDGMNDHASGYRVEGIENPLTQMARSMDKLARGKKMENSLRS